MRRQRSPHATGLGRLGETAPRYRPSVGRGDRRAGLATSGQTFGICCHSGTRTGASLQSDAQAGSPRAGQGIPEPSERSRVDRPDRRSRHQRCDLRGAAGPDPLMQRPGGDHREVGERPSRQAILNPSGNQIWQCRDGGPRSTRPVPSASRGYCDPPATAAIK